MKYFYLALCASLLSMALNAQFVRVATSPTAIANQVPGYSQVASIATKTFSYTPSTPPSAPTPTDGDSTTVNDKLYRYADIFR